MDRNIVTAFLSVVGGHVLGTVVVVVTTPLLVRLLGPTQYGEYTTLFAVFGLVMIFSKSGIHDGLRKYLAEERSDDEWRGSVFGFYFRVATVMTLLVAGLFLVLPATPLVEIVLHPKYERYFPLLAVWAVVNQYSAYLRKSLMGLKLEHVSEPIKLLRKVTFGVSAIGLVYFGYGIVGVIGGHVLSAVVVTAVSAVYVQRHVSLDHVRRRVPTGFPVRELLYFNLLTVVYIFLLRSLAHVDVLMVESFATSEQVGYYRSALVLVEFLWFVPLSLQSVMLQSTSDLWRREEYDRIEALAAQVTRYNLLFTALLAIGLAALAPVVVPLYYGAEFTPAIAPLLVLLPGTVGFAVARPILAISQAKGSMRTLILATGFTAVLNFVLNLLLIPRFGMLGAAAATTVGYGSLPVVQALGARRLGYRPFSDVRLSRVLVTVCVAGVAIYATAAVIRSDVLELAVVPVVGFVTYSALALKTGAVERREVVQFLEKLPEPVRSKAVEMRSYF